MTGTDLAPAPAPSGASDIMERVLAAGDLAKLTPEQRSRYYAEVCQSLGLNPLTRPFEYLSLNNRLVLYARKEATDQLRSIRGVTVEIVSRETIGDLYVVTARATLPDGRHDEEIGAVNIAGLRGDALANALMKAGTKAKRRVTLSICGLGWLDESEVDSIPDARRTVVEETGEIVTPPAQATAPAERLGEKGLAQFRQMVAAARTRYNALPSDDQLAVPEEYITAMDVSPGAPVDEIRHAYGLLKAFIAAHPAPAEATA